MTQAASSALPLSTRTDPETQPIEAALVGAPNCGKTALFNALTGATQKVGNYSGVTVERKIRLGAWFSGILPIEDQL